MANHKDNSIIINNSKTVIKRGQLLTSRLKLSEITGIQESKIERILKYLKSEQQIEQQNLVTSRLITITNYNEYQESEQQIEHGMNTERTPNEHRMNTINNDNNDNNDNNNVLGMFENIRKEDMLIPKTSLAFLWNAICVNLPKVISLSDKRNKQEKLRLAERPAEEWEKVFIKLNTSEFCKGNNNTGWKATYDWIISNTDNALKVIEGKYDGQARTGIPTTNLVTSQQITNFFEGIKK